MEFSYQIKAKTGEFSEGRIEAPSESSAVEVLQARGYVVLSLRRLDTGILTSDLAQVLSRVNNKDIVVFTRQLSTLIDAGMPLAEGLRVLAKQVEKPVFRKIIGRISDGVEGGSSLSVALSEFPNLFSPFFVKLVKSGELSGKLQDALSYLADYLERNQEIVSKIRGALAYPLFVIFAMIVVMIIMTVYVLPNLLVIFKETGMTDLPFTTRALIWFTDFVNAHLLSLTVGALGCAIAFVAFVRTEQGRTWLDNLKIKLPVFGVILKNLYLARMAESLATLIKSDIAILDVIKITADVVGNRNFKVVLLAAEESVRGGGSMSEVFGQFSEVPPLLTSMVSIGERTGKLEFMLGHVSKFYRSESEADISNISQLIEPILVFILGIGVAILVASVLLPIYNMVGAG